MTAAADREAKRLQMELPLNYDRAIDDNDVWEACYSAGLKWLTRKQIAKAVGRSVSPHLVARIERMVSEGALEKQVFTMRNNAQGYQYQASEG
jgi:hypothetical protein